MEILHFVFGKFQTKSPEFNVWIADSFYSDGKYNGLTNFIINRFNRVFYKNLGYQIAEFPEVITYYENNFLYLKFYPATLEERGSDISPLCHCFLFTPQQMAAINYAPWRLRNKFMQGFGGLEIIGYDGAIWITRDEAAEKKAAKTFKIEIEASQEVATWQLEKNINPFSQYYAIRTNRQEDVFQHLEPQKKLDIFASGVLCRGDLGLVRLLGSGPIHFALVPTHFENAPRNYNLLDEFGFQQLRHETNEAVQHPSLISGHADTRPPEDFTQPSSASSSSHTQLTEATNDTTGGTKRIERPALAKDEYPYVEKKEVPEKHEELKLVKSSFVAQNEIQPRQDRTDTVTNEVKKIQVDINTKTTEQGITVFIRNKSSFQIEGSLVRHSKEPGNTIAIQKKIFINEGGGYEIIDLNVQNGKIYTYELNASPAENQSMVFVIETQAHAHPLAPIITESKVFEDRVMLLWKSDNEFEVKYYLRKLEMDENSRLNIVNEFNIKVDNYFDHEIRINTNTQYEVAAVDVVTNVQSSFTKSEIIVLKSAATLDVSTLSPHVKEIISENLTDAVYQQKKAAKQNNFFSTYWKVIILLLAIISGSYIVIKLSFSQRKEPKTRQENKIDSSRSEPLQISNLEKPIDDAAPGTTSKKVKDPKKDPKKDNSDKSPFIRIMTNICFDFGIDSFKFDEQFGRSQILREKKKYAQNHGDSSVPSFDSLVATKDRNFNNAYNAIIKKTNEVLKKQANDLKQQYNIAYLKLKKIYYTENNK